MAAKKEKYLQKAKQKTAEDIEPRILDTKQVTKNSQYIYA